MLQTVIKPFVVAVVEAQLLQIPLAVPVRLGNEEEIRIALPHCRSELGPILPLGTLARPASPRALEDRIEEQHCHIAADTVALSGDVEHRLDRGVPEPWLECVELQHVGPCGKVGVPSASIY